MNKIHLIFLSFILLFSCKTKQTLVTPIEPIVDEDMEFEILDTLVVDGNDPRFQEKVYEYQPSVTRFFDLLHTKINIQFDWAKQRAIASASLDMVPLFKPQDSIILDAKTMDISSVKLNGVKPLSFVNTGSELKIALDRKYHRNEKINLIIDYVAKPNEGNISGSAAIQSNKGLFFINPLNTDLTKPQQIWTQGETENNSKWFPTFDKPNERCTQEIFITVEDRFTTLSNGKLISSIKNNDGTRTDYWKQDKPHAPYLFMMAIGEYAWVEDKYKDLPLYYIVEKPFAPYAKSIFNHTPEMLAFFEDKLQYKYAWDKYAQVVTRDYVSGAMENTGAVVFGEFVQKTDRELIDDDNDAIIAHEMFHHWFGDLVTCESWANLTLNEGFANYAEYLWKEHQYGKMNADEHKMNELYGYINSAFGSGMHPLIYYNYGDKEDMFDAHSYNKGGLVLHYLRNYLGDDLFFTSLSHYLKKYEFTAVEVDELRMAFEDTSGEDLHWFFDQFYLREGHPTLNVKYQNENNRIRIQVEQDSINIFKMPVEIAFYDSLKNVTYHKVWLSKQKEDFEITIKSNPYAISFDGKDVIPGLVVETKAEKEWMNLYQVSPMFIDKQHAFDNISIESEYREKLIEKAINDPYYYFRKLSIDDMEQRQNSEKYKDRLINLSTNDTNSHVREAALRALSTITFEGKVNQLSEILTHEKSYPVLAQALFMLHEEDKTKALEYAKVLSAENNGVLDNKVAAVFADQSGLEIEKWFKNKIKTNSVYQVYELAGYYNIYGIKQNNIQAIRDIIDTYGTISLESNFDKYRRFICTASLVGLKNMISSGFATINFNKDEATKLINEKIKEIKYSEKDDELIERYSEF